MSWTPSGGTGTGFAGSGGGGGGWGNAGKGGSEGGSGGASKNEQKFKETFQKLNSMLCLPSGIFGASLVVVSWPEASSSSSKSSSGFSGCVSPVTRFSYEYRLVDL